VARKEEGGDGQARMGRDRVLQGGEGVLEGLDKGNGRLNLPGAGLAVGRKGHGGILRRKVLEGKRREGGLFRSRCCCWGKGEEGEGRVCCLSW